MSCCGSSAFGDIRQEIAITSVFYSDGSEGSWSPGRPGYVALVNGGIECGHGDTPGDAVAKILCDIIGRLQLHASSMRSLIARLFDERTALRAEVAALQKDKRELAEMLATIAGKVHHEPEFVAGETFYSDSVSEPPGTLTVTGIGGPSAIQIKDPAKP